MRDIYAHPLHWPPSWPRSKQKERSQFGNHTVAHARDMVLQELERLGASKAILSTNMALRLDGQIRSGQTEPQDSGVAVYFRLRGEDKCFPCDRWDKVAHNLWAIYKSIEALRGLERWGAKDMVNAAFRGFKALPAPSDIILTGIRYFNECTTPQELKSRYKHYAKEFHPDRGGDGDEFHEMKRQYEIEKSRFE